MSTERVTDDELVARARAGDQAAFGELVDRYRTAAYRAALAALGAPQEAEDAAQDAFVRAWRRLDSFRGDASFKTWLLAIVWRQALNRRRSVRRWWRWTVSLDVFTQAAAGNGDRSTDLAGDAAPGWTPEEIAAGRQLALDIRGAIKSLPPKLGDALLLAQSGEYSYEEIGAMVAAPTGTVKWRVSEARRAVRAYLLKRGHTPDGRRW